MFGESECHTSPAGYSLASSAVVPRYCKPGYLSAAGDSVCTEITAGMFTAAGANVEVEAPLGFDTYVSGGIQYEDGLTGKYITAQKIVDGTTTTADADTCTAGHYCPYGLLKQYPCPAGHYCPAGANLPTACAAGYYNIHIM